jgi:hypothetical protein
LSQVFILFSLRLGVLAVPKKLTLVTLTKAY